MLNAVLAGKKRGTGLEGRRLILGNAQGAEDILTATVFERLSYLPDVLFNTLFTQLLGYKFGPLKTIEYWPSWLQGDRRIEPDMLLTDAHSTVLIEAKRHDHTQQQYAEQLAAELQAGWTQGNLTDDCFLLALGGHYSIHLNSGPLLHQKIIDHLPVNCGQSFRLICCSWRHLYTLIKSIINDTEYNNPGLTRMLADITAVYSWHGLRTHSMSWLSTMPTLGSISEHRGTFDHWSMK